MNIWLLTVHIEDTEDEITVCANLEVCRRTAIEVVTYMTKKFPSIWAVDEVDMLRLAAEITSGDPLSEGRYMINTQPNETNNWLTFTEHWIVT